MKTTNDTSARNHRAAAGNPILRLAVIAAGSAACGFLAGAQNGPEISGWMTAHQNALIIGCIGLAVLAAASAVRDIAQDLGWPALSAIVAGLAAMMAFGPTLLKSAGVQ